MKKQKTLKKGILMNALSILGIAVLIGIIWKQKKELDEYHSSINKAFTAR